MARDDVFRRSFEAGTAFLTMTSERAEALVKELVKAGEVQKGKAQKVIDEVVERSRKGTDELRQIVRDEISRELAALGLATKSDIARIEARLDAMAASQPAEPAVEPRKAPAAKKAAKSAAKSTAKATAKKRAAAGSGDAGSATPTGGPPADDPAGG